MKGSSVGLGGDRVAGGFRGGGGKGVRRRGAEPQRT